MSLVKALVVLGSGGTVATGVYLTSDYWMSSKEGTMVSIKDSLKGKKLISSIADSEVAKKQWEAEFDSASDAIKSLLNKSDLTSETGGKALESWCSLQMSLNSHENKEVLSNVEKYCLVRSVASQISRKNKNLLKADVETGWSSTYQKRKAAQETSNRSSVGLSGAWQEGKETEELKIIKKWCSDNSEKEFLVSNKGNSDLYDNVLKWCTQEGA
ncbi:hypothetical protein MHC_04720 [Mycoplasma haemocanis str. Illinois]|uniref:Uncharacterized protein n=1 Tax=Mycoplasma haemocanis (strain Illinois) TaxID=1111676 RepID=H6N828_MYCHN|nr:hypothetical protein [Mycoplasma haemocanis]AEW45800.1 hypothetical protein MHC_04720 [Mycoplasma haemocanis str. Illinois]